MLFLQKKQEGLSIIIFFANLLCSIKYCSVFFVVILKITIINLNQILHGITSYRMTTFDIHNIVWNKKDREKVAQFSVQSWAYTLPEYTVCTCVRSRTLHTHKD